MRGTIAILQGMPPAIDKLALFAAAARIDRRRRATERTDRAALARTQARALAETVAHARSASPYYRELYSANGVDAHSPLEALPPVDKAGLMARFDEWVTDARLTLDTVRADLGSDDLLFGEYATMGSGGSSRQPGVYVFDRGEWAHVCAAALRATRWCGHTPRLPRRRLAVIHAPGGAHMASRTGRSIDIGVFRGLHLASTMPRADLVAALNAFRPDGISGYASVVALLAAEALDGNLRIAPSIVMATSEPVTEEMRARIRRAWGTEPFNLYATTETGTIAFDCAHDHGLHVFEDAAIVEVVDADDRPVADGEVGDHLLVTNLFSRTQPFIRYRLNDMTGFLAEPCPCGLTFRVLRPVEGRTDDLLEFPGISGASPVVLHPTAFTPVVGHDGAGEVEIVQRADRLYINAVPRAGADRSSLAADLSSRARAVLRGAGCADVEIQVALVDRLARHPVAGKIKLIRHEA